MISKDVKRLLQKLNDPMTRALEGAAGLAVGRGHYEVTVEHLLTKLFEDGTGDAGLILTRLGVEPGRVGKALTDALERFKSGNTGRPAFSPLLLGLIERAWVAGSVHHGLTDIRSGAFLEAFLESDALATSPVREAMSEATADTVRERFFDLIEGSDENRASRRTAGRVPDARGGNEGETALDLYTHSMTDQAREGNIDAVFGRDREIRQVIDVLSRRRKNNPILVGEAGVGKTAVVEGLALRIVAGDVPESLREAEIAALDLGALQAGAGVKGEFEARMKAVIDAVKDAPRPTILFIDEAHTLVGAGGAAGTGDAANLLKPALARGELRSIAATTWSEYKRHIEKDPALARRFQMVKVDEPGIETAVVMMRGIRDRYEDHHHVQITDAAVRAAVELSDRYLSGRQLPDKAVDLLDTASARVKMSQDATPAALDDVGRRLHELETEITAVRRDLTAGLRADDDGLAELEAERDRFTETHAALDARWREEQTAARALDAARQSAAGGDGAAGASDGIWDLHARLAALQTDGNPLVHAEVGERVVAEVIADWTGIPIGNMIKDEAQMLLELEARLTERIRGQDEALGEIADALRTAKAGMRKKDAPIGVFLLAGPSGVGKTETARALAELLFGGERFLVSINMSEYQESHTTSQLKGAPPGYVGYGEGGVLTEAVRQRPYSVVLLDEVEKAHIDVMEMFYQVFDRGILRDGEGREVDFSNAVILCTSNVGSELVQQASDGRDGAEPRLAPDAHPRAAREPLPARAPRADERGPVPEPRPRRDGRHRAAQAEQSGPAPPRGARHPLRVLRHGRGAHRGPLHDHRRRRAQYRRHHRPDGAPGGEPGAAHAPRRGASAGRAPPRARRRRRVHVHVHRARRADARRHSGAACRDAGRCRGVRRADRRGSRRHGGAHRECDLRRGADGSRRPVWRRRRRGVRHGRCAGRRRRTGRLTPSPMLFHRIARHEFAASALPADTFRVVSFEGDEAISQPYRFEVNLVSNDPEIAFEDVLGQPATLTMYRGDEPSEVAGIVVDFEQSMMPPRADGVPIRLPRRARAAARAPWPLVPEPHLPEPDRRRDRPQYPRCGRRRGRLQARRLVRRRGSTARSTRRPTSTSCSACSSTRASVTTSTHAGTTETLVLSDDSSDAPDVAGLHKLPYRHSAGLLSSDSNEFVGEFVARQQIVTAKTQIKDRNYRDPETEILVESEIDAELATGIESDYGTHVMDSGRATRLVKIRNEEIETGRLVMTGGSDCQRFRSGHHFALEEHYREGHNQTYLLTHVHHAGSQSSTAAAGGEATTGYRNTFGCVPASVPYRPPRRTPEPKLPGVLTARVESGGGDYAPVDDQGRYHVRMPFDLGDAGAAQASKPVRLAQPYTGPGYGQHFPGPQGHRDGHRVRRRQRGPRARALNDL